MRLEINSTETWGDLHGRYIDRPDDKSSARFVAADAAFLLTIDLSANPQAYPSKPPPVSVVGHFESVYSAGPTLLIIPFRTSVLR
jgi:hypothetical protein